MENDVLPVTQAAVRGTDSNTLLRMYDLARERLATAASQQIRERAGRACERITKELRKRNVRPV